MRNLKFCICPLLVFMLIAGCTNPVMDNLQETTKSDTSFESFLVANGFQEMEGQYVLEGDIAFSKEAVFRDYQEYLKGKRGNIAVNGSGGRYVWSDTQKLSLTYSFSTDMATKSLSDSQVKDAFRDATIGWMATGAVRFVEVGSNPLFTVKTVNVSDSYTAMSFFPYGPYEYVLKVNLRYVDSSFTTYNRMVGLFIHELGHTLGLAHEHQRADSPNKYGQGTYGEPFGSFDSASIMNYGNSPYLSGISDGDAVLVTSLYGPSMFFDPKFYLAQYGDLQNAFGDDYVAARRHYLEYGINEGRKTSFVFDPVYYVTNYQDLMNAFGSNYKAITTHFLVYGINEGRQASPVFHSVYYLDNYSDLKNAFGFNHYSAIVHYFMYGINEGRKASPTFDPVFYLNYYSDLKNAFGTNYYDGINHYFAYGIREGRIGVP